MARSQTANHLILPVVVFPLFPVFEVQIMNMVSVVYCILNYASYNGRTGDWANIKGIHILIILDLTMGNYYQLSKLLQRPQPPVTNR